MKKKFGFVLGLTVLCVLFGYPVVWHTYVALWGLYTFLGADRDISNFIAGLMASLLATAISAILCMAFVVATDD